MNNNKLKEAEEVFLTRYPDGFDHPEMIAIGKKHNVSKMNIMTKEFLSKASLENPNLAIENIIKIICRSSMISLFEKPKYRDYVRLLSNEEQEQFLTGIYETIYGDQKQGLEQQQVILEHAKLAKWSLLTILPAYYNLEYEVFVKPTTTKNIIDFLEIKEVIYKPKFSWDFYENYRDIINNLKLRVDPSLTSSNPAFCGFLMISIEMIKQKSEI